MYNNNTEFGHNIPNTQMDLVMYNKEVLKWKSSSFGIQ